MTERHYFNVDPDRRSKFWNFNGTAFLILGLELNEPLFLSIDPFLRISTPPPPGLPFFQKESKILLNENMKTEFLALFILFKKSSKNKKCCIYELFLELLLELELVRN